MSEPYDDGNIFAKILRGEIPCARVHEDACVLVFMDVMPQGDGHTLVVPKAKARNILDVAPDTLATLIGTVQRTAQAVKKAFAADGVTIFQFNEPAGGQTVFHLHFHVVPRFDGVPLKKHEGAMADAEVLKAHAAKIAAVF